MDWVAQNRYGLRVLLETATIDSLLPRAHRRISTISGVGEVAYGTWQTAISESREWIYEKEANAGRLQILDESRIARQFLAMISDQLFWPAMLTPDFSASDREAKQAVEEALLTIMSRCGSQSRRHDRSSPTSGPV